ncbi:hypothetical protein [uncultured Ruegeria sp.]|nr:hypothetical protein [uncultured Ruegeria sp.]
MNLEIAVIGAALAIGVFFPWERYPRAKYVLIGLIAIGAVGKAIFS